MIIKEIKFCGIKILSESLTDDIYKLKILCGLYKIRFNLYLRIVDYSLFTIKFMQKTFGYGKSIIKLFNLFKFKLSYKNTKKFLWPILVKYLKNKTKLDKMDIIPLFNHAGETFLFFHHLDEFINKNNIKNPVFISTFPYLKDISKMFYPEISFIRVPDVFFELHFVSKKEIPVGDNVKLFSTLGHFHFVNLEKSISEGMKKNFYEEILLTMNLSKESIKFPVISDEIVKSIKTKMEILNLKKPFVYIAPDAQSNGTLSLKFWDTLTIELFKLGYDVFFNSYPLGVINSYYKYSFLSLQEAYYLGQEADIIIGIRSGLMDVISNKNSKIFCIYNKFLYRGKSLPELSAEKVQSAFSLKYLPYVNPENIIEIDGEEEEEDKILEIILQNIRKEYNASRCN